MNRFQVWVRQVGNSCRVRVDGMQNAAWLLDRLARALVFKTSGPVVDDWDSYSSTFQVACSGQMTFLMVRRALVAIPEVSLTLERAENAGPARRPGT